MKVGIRFVFYLNGINKFIVKMIKTDRIINDMNNIYCTLFNSNYLDKGLALYFSLKKVCSNFKLYVFAFDDLTYSVLKDLNEKNLIVISLKEFETKQMIEIKKKRSQAEYCWTCTPITIDYVFDNYDEPCCTYIDADMFFYKDPIVLIEEMKKHDSSVLIVKHNFPKNKATRMAKIHGEFCVEFNTFLNNEAGRKCLEWWKQSCINECKYSRDPNKNVGDQTYLESFQKLFNGVHVLLNIGGGIAPWNFARYTFKKENNVIYVMDNNNIWEEIVFCHFQGIRYLPFGLINIQSHCKNIFVKNELYIPYLKGIQSVRSFLKNNYNINFTIKKSYFKNPIKRFIQNYVMPFRIRQFSDILSLRRITDDKN